MSSTGAPDIIWRPETDLQSFHGDGKAIYEPDLFDAIDSTIESLSDELRTLSLDIHDHPELKWEEHHAHDVLTDFMAKHGFQVKQHYILPTAWEATFTQGQGGPTIGVNSEMDALPGVGHACGHNLIAIAGVAVACAVKAILEKKNINGKVVLLGTPAEEGGRGKVVLLEGGAYEGMDACVMCHPAPGPPNSASLSSSLALKGLQVEYTGHTAHAALAPWEGQNALDAAVAAHTNIGLLRQQLKPNHRVHGIIEGRDWAPNIVPDYAKLLYYIRSETWAEVLAAVPRVENCFKAAALATGCKIDVKPFHSSTELRQNKALGDEFANVFESKYGSIDRKYGIAGASTDFGDITYALPALHPGFGIPTKPNGGNHTREFAASAATIEAHKATLNVAKALAAVGVRLLTDEGFLNEVKKTFEEDKKIRGDV
ncbi:hypothetical protein QCA50_013147 [Cerrena zonata]|uniref:Peptidase M20 domain-containing protein 2 n=1 Tax=Cerrena zonata TaxID=2478898 RepID=A0AAW0FSF5_9APHY